MLAILSSVAGLLVAHAVTPLLIGLLNPSSDPASLITTIDLRLLAFTSFLTVVTVIFCGLFPAIRQAKEDMYTSLKSGRRLTGGAGAQARKFILVAQIALSLVLVVAAGLFTRTLLKLMSSDLGFNPRGVLVARLSLPNQNKDRSRFESWRHLVQEVRLFPGVERASFHLRPCLPESHNSRESGRRPLRLTQPTPSLRSHSSLPTILLKKEGRAVNAHYYANEGHGFAKRERQIDSIRRPIGRNRRNLITARVLSALRRTPFRA